MTDRPRRPLPPDPIIEVYKRDVDVSLLIENLRRTPEERILRIMDMQRLVEELREAKRKPRL